MTIRVLSFDYDGCLGWKKGSDDVINNNQKFLDQIRAENLKYRLVHTFIGSNRQSKESNQWSMDRNKNGSCFPAIKAVSDHLNTTFEPFLLADIYGNLDDGESYQNAINTHYSGKHARWVFDETKASLLYAQMHKMANMHPNEKIVFDFYDDRLEILASLRRFFTKNPGSIPRNVILYLNQYKGKNIAPIARITGQGIIDENYRETVEALAQSAAYRQDGPRGVGTTISVAEYANPTALENRKALPKQAANIDVDQAPNPRFTAALNEIENKANQLLEESSSHIAAAKAAYLLYDSLLEARKDMSTFQSKANEAIETAKRSELKDHRGYLKQILGYAGLAILAVLTPTTLGIAYAIAGSIQYAFNGHFFFSTKFNTDAINKVLDLEKTIDQESEPSLLLN